MSSLPKAYRLLLLAYAVLGVLLWSTPLLSILHAESSAVVAAAAFFGGGVTTRTMLREGMDLRRILLLQELALVVPWVLLTVSLIWQPNCGYVHGLMYFLLFPVVTVPFAVGLMVLLETLRAPRSTLYFFVIGLAVIAVPPIVDIGFHPQFYTYNHVFGGFLGPVYDDQITVRPGIFAFRAVTLLWALFFLFGSALLREKSSAYPLAAIAVGLAFGYAFSAELGMITTHDVIRKELGGVRHTARFDIYYDPEVIPEEEMDRIADDHEFRFEQLSRKLRTTVDERVQSYVYPDVPTKARLTGSRHTNVSPVWLPHPQTHVLYSAYEHVFPHELVHVFSREFGLPLLRASVSVGLVEGLAVALEPPDGRPGPTEEISAAILSSLEQTRQVLAADAARSVAAHLSPLGFWTARGAVSYAAMGSFVGYLLEAYEIERLKTAYARADFEGAYGKPLEALAGEWSAHVLALEAVASSSLDLAAKRFAVPSLFEKDCPHYVPRHQRMFDRAATALIRRDTTRAEALLDDALRLRPDYVTALEAWSRLRLSEGDSESVLARLDRANLDTLTAALSIALGDAQVLQRNAVAARRSYEAAIERLPAHAHEAHSLVLLRAAAADDAQALDSYLSRGRSLRTESPSFESPAAMALYALAAAGENRYEQAFELMRTSSGEGLKASASRLGDALVRRRFVWLARLAFRSGLGPEAVAYADSAASAYDRVGAFNEAAVQRDFISRVEWLVSEDLDRIAEGRGRPAHRFERVAPGPNNRPE